MSQCLSAIRPPRDESRSGKPLEESLMLPMGSSRAQGTGLSMGRVIGSVHSILVQAALDALLTWGGPRRTFLAVYLCDSPLTVSSLEFEYSPTPSPDFDGSHTLWQTAPVLMAQAEPFNSRYVIMFDLP